MERKYMVSSCGYDPKEDEYYAVALGQNLTYEEAVEYLEELVDTYELKDLSDEWIGYEMNEVKWGYDEEGDYTIVWMNEIKRWEYSWEDGCGKYIEDQQEQAHL